MAILKLAAVTFVLAIVNCSASVAQEAKIAPFVVEIITRGPTPKDGWLIILAKNDLKDLKGHIVSKEELAKIVRTKKMIRGVAEQVLILQAKANDDTTFAMVVSTVQAIEQARDPAVPTYVYILAIAQ